MAEKDGNELKMLLDDYPYAEDGLLIWNAILKFATDYLSLYYDDHTEGRRVRFLHYSIFHAVRQISRLIYLISGHRNPPVQTVCKLM